MKKIKSMGHPTVKRVIEAGPLKPKWRSNTSKTVVFLAICLNKDSTEMLKDLVKKHSQQGLLGVINGRTLTIQYRPTDEEVDAAALGNEVELKVEEIFINEWCQCVTVSGYEKYKVSVDNKHPHIVVAHENSVLPTISDYIVKYSENHFKSSSELTLR